jgi:hypothetical protein
MLLIGPGGGEGGVWPIQVVPPSVVATRAEVSLFFSPPATQVEVEGQETLVRRNAAEDGMFRLTQVVPPSVVMRTAPLAASRSKPTATQKAVDAQETAKTAVPAGTVWLAQVAPPSSVVTM